MHMDIFQVSPFEMHQAVRLLESSCVYVYARAYLYCPAATSEAVPQQQRNENFPIPPVSTCRLSENSLGTMLPVASFEIQSFFLHVVAFGAKTIKDQRPISRACHHWQYGCWKVFVCMCMHVRICTALESWHELRPLRLCLSNKGMRTFRTHLFL